MFALTRSIPGLPSLNPIAKSAPNIPKIAPLAPAVGTSADGCRTAHSVRAADGHGLRRMGFGCGAPGVVRPATGSRPRPARGQSVRGIRRGGRHRLMPRRAWRRGLRRGYRYRRRRPPRRPRRPAGRADEPLPRFWGPKTERPRRHPRADRRDPPRQSGAWWKETTAAGAVCH